VAALVRVGLGVDRDDSDRDDEEVALEDDLELVVDTAAIEEAAEETAGALRLELERGRDEAADDAAEVVVSSWGERFLTKRLRASWSRR